LTSTPQAAVAPIAAELAVTAKTVSRARLFMTFSWEDDQRARAGKGIACLRWSSRRADPASIPVPARAGRFFRSALSALKATLTEVVTDAAVLYRSKPGPGLCGAVVSGPAGRLREHGDTADPAQVSLAPRRENGRHGGAIRGSRSSTLRVIDRAADYLPGGTADARIH
jgi:hypothetical protein